MNKKVYSNDFTFLLFQEDGLLTGREFSADQYNPFTRYSVDIRGILPGIITKMQKVLSKRNYETQVSSDLDLYKFNQKMIKLYPMSKRNNMRYRPQSIIRHIESKTIKGVECKIGLYINENPIVERIFYVDGFNSVAKWSLDIVYAVTDVVNSISKLIKDNDITNMWDDYDLINKRGLSISQIRDLPPFKRKELLRKIHMN